MIVVPLSKAHTQTEWPLLIAVHTTGVGVAVIDQIKAADKSRFGACLGRLSDEELTMRLPVVYVTGTAT